MQVLLRDCGAIAAILTCAVTSLYGRDSKFLLLKDKIPSLVLLYYLLSLEVSVCMPFMVTVSLRYYAPFKN